MLLGEPKETEMGMVRASPSPMAGEGRHSLTSQPLAPPGLRILTYNILADQYVGTDYAQEVLFTYCPPE